MPQSPYREMEASLKQSAEERRRQINGIGLGSSLYTFIYIHVYIAFGLEERFAASGWQEKAAHRLPLIAGRAEVGHFRLPNALQKEKADGLIIWIGIVTKFGFIKIFSHI